MQRSSSDLCMTLVYSAGVFWQKCLAVMKIYPEPTGVERSVAPYNWLPDIWTFWVTQVCLISLCKKLNS
jgi:hypothetical protein